MTVVVSQEGPVWTITLDRPAVRNAVDGPTANALANAVRAFEASDDARVAVLTGAHGTFCAGADLKAFHDGRRNRLAHDGDGPMGPTRMLPRKPVLAAIEGHAVAGGLELACWCDLRIASQSAILGVFCRRWGVPLIDGGTVRLTHLLGRSRALDLVLTGRAVSADEALAIGLVHRVVPDGEALDAALQLARTLAGFPWECLLADRASVLEAFDRPFADALAAEFTRGLSVLDSASTADGLARFTGGAGRHGQGT